MVNPVSRSNQGFFGTITSGLNGVSAASNRVGAEAFKFSHKLNQFTPANLRKRFVQMYVTPHVNGAFATVTRPLDTVRSHIDNTYAGVHRTITRPIRQAQHAVTNPIATVRSEINRTLSRAERAVARPFEAVQHAAISPFNHVHRPISQALGHSTSGIHQLRNRICSALMGTQRY